jgi:hypothetical protein
MDWMRLEKIDKKFDLFRIQTHSGLVRFRRIEPGIVPANQSLYKLEKQSGQESFQPTDPAETNKASIPLNPHGLRANRTKPNKYKHLQEFMSGDEPARSLCLCAGSEELVLLRLRLQGRRRANQVE